jgi:PAS domain-containing protein
MNDQRKTKAQLIAELASLRQDFAVAQQREEQLRVAKEIERHHAEETRQEREDRWLLALSGYKAGVWDWNLKPKELFFSSCWKTMLGFGEDEIGTTLNEWSDRVHPEDLPRVMQAVEEYLARKTEFYETEHRMRCRDGNYK